MRTINVKTYMEENESLKTIVTYGDKALDAGQIISRIGGGIFSDALIKAVLNLADVKFKPARVCARVFGFTTLSSTFDRMTNKTFNEYRAAYEYMLEHAEVNITDKEEEKEDGAE